MWSWKDVMEQLAFVKVKTFGDSASDTEWKWQHGTLLLLSRFTSSQG